MRWRSVGGIGCWEHDPLDRQEPLVDLAERDLHGAQAVVEAIQAFMDGPKVGAHG